MNGILSHHPQTENRAYAAAARRRGDRSLKARIESALQASKLHYERTGRCFYITTQIVESDCVFDELEDEEQFWDPDLLLPERLTLEQLREEHYDSLRAAGAVFATPSMNGNGLVNGGHLIGTPLLSQSTESRPSNSHSTLMGSQLSGYGNDSSLSFHGSQTQTLQGTNFLFPGATPFNLWTHQCMPTPHINGIGDQADENHLSVLSEGLPEDEMAAKAFRKHVRPDAIDQVIGRTSVHLNGWLHDDNTEGPEELLQTSMKFERNLEVRLRDHLFQGSDVDMANHLHQDSDLTQSEDLLDSFWHDPDEDMGNHFEVAFHDDLEGHLDRS